MQRSWHRLESPPALPVFPPPARLRLHQGAKTWDRRGISKALEVTLSIGLASAPPHATDRPIARANSAMYRAKHLDRQRVALV